MRRPVAGLGPAPVGPGVAREWARSAGAPLLLLACSHSLSPASPPSPLPSTPPAYSRLCSAEQVATAHVQEMEAERQRAQALAEHWQASLSSRVRSWWGQPSTSENPTIVATADATGRAVATDTTRTNIVGLERPGVRVDASGTASVNFQERPPAAGAGGDIMIPVEGRLVDTRAGPERGSGSASVSVREGSRVLK